MDENKRQRSAYASARQKKTLLEYLTKHPELISCKVTPTFSHRDSQKLWMKIARELNSMPRARKTWRQWRKTWQDLKAYTKKRQRKDGCYDHNELRLTSSMVLLTEAEQEALGIKNVSSTSTYQNGPEFIASEAVEHDSTSDHLNNDNGSTGSFSDAPNSPVEEKVLSNPIEDSCNVEAHEVNKNNIIHSDSCVFNCNILAKQEQKKIEIKESYLNFKKSYLKQKLKLLKEQTEALKTIAKNFVTNRDLAKPQTLLQPDFE